MKLPVILVAFIVLSIGVINNRILANQIAVETDDNSVLSDTDESTPTPSPLVTASPTVSSTSSPEPSRSPSPVPSATTSQTGNFIYPGANVVNSGGTLELQTTDDAQVVTNWYKEKIRSMGLNVKSFVQTTSNGNVKNKLAGADGNREVEIEITKSSDSNTVYISVKE